MGAYYDVGGVEIWHGDAVAVLGGLPSGIVQTCVTSPPYWGLRDYGAEGQIGLEATPEEYISKMVGVFAGVRRVLRDDGTIWVNMGDSYAEGKNLSGMPWRLALALQADGWYLRSDIIWHKPNPMPESVTDRPTKSHEHIFLLSKRAKYFYDADAVREKVGEPTRRQKTFRGDCYTNNATFNNSHDYSGHEPYSDDEPSMEGRNLRDVWTVPTAPYPGAHFATFPPKLIEPCVKAGATDRTCPVCGKGWERIVELGDIVSTGGSEDGIRPSGNPHTDFVGGAMNCGAFTQRAHLSKGFRSACDHPHAEKDTVPSIVLDPFHGSGTTGMVARELGCRYIGIELNEEYIKLSLERFEQNLLAFGGSVVD